MASWKTKRDMRLHESAQKVSDCAMFDLMIEIYVVGFLVDSASRLRVAYYNGVLIEAVDRVIARKF